MQTNVDIDIPTVDGLLDLTPVGMQYSVQPNVANATMTIYGIVHTMENSDIKTKLHHCIMQIRTIFGIAFYQSDYILERLDRTIDVLEETVNSVDIRYRAELLSLVHTIRDYRQ